MQNFFPHEREYLIDKFDICKEKLSLPSVKRLKDLNDDTSKNKLFLEVRQLKTISKIFSEITLNLKYRYSLLGFWIREKSMEYPEIQKVLLIPQEEYLEICFLVEKSNFETIYKISELTYKIRQEFSKKNFDFSVINLDCFNQKTYVENKDFFKIYEIEEINE